MADSLKELEGEYRSAVARLQHAQEALTKNAMDPLGPEDPPEISKDRRAAENEAREARDAYVPARDRYWRKRWGVEGNSPAK